MKEYMVYTNGDSFQINAGYVELSLNLVRFFTENDEEIAVFNFANIVGWEEKREDVK